MALSYSPFKCQALPRLMYAGRSAGLARIALVKYSMRGQKAQPRDRNPAADAFVLRHQPQPGRAHLFDPVDVKVTSLTSTRSCPPLRIVHDLPSDLQHRPELCDDPLPDPAARLLALGLHAPSTSTTTVAATIPRSRIAGPPVNKSPSHGPSVRKVQAETFGFARCIHRNRDVGLNHLRTGLTSEFQSS